MTAMWTACRAVAVGLLTAVTIGTILNLTAADLAHTLLWTLKAAAVVAGIAACTLCVALIASLYIDAWKDRTR